eukprot:3187906-Amphidinium_carterae.1
MAAVCATVEVFAWGLLWCFEWQNDTRKALCELRSAKPRVLTCHSKLSFWRFLSLDGAPLASPMQMKMDEETF